MKKRISNFSEEITTNFSGLFVETFFIRYLSEFDKDYLLETIKNVNALLNEKIYNSMKDKLETMGYSDTDIENSLK